MGFVIKVSGKFVRVDGGGPGNRAGRNSSDYKRCVGGVPPSMQASTRRFEAGPTGLAADPHAGWVPEAACPDSQQLGRFLNHSRVAHHLCKAGAAYGTCEAIRQQLQGCSGAASGRFTTRTQPRRLRCGVDTCCPHWRTDACWACGLKWHSPTSASPPHCPSSLPMRWLGRAEIEECARGKLLIFQGDSLTRQLFNRLIWWVRGIPSVVEHYYQEDAYYAFSEQAGDAFTLRRHSYARGKLDAAAVATNAEIAAKWARVDAAVAGNATLDPQQVRVLYQAYLPHISHISPYLRYISPISPRISPQVHVLYQAFRNSKYPIDDDIAGGRFMSARVRRGQVQWDKWERRDRCDHEHPEGCAVREREGGGASAVPWDPARLLGLVQGQMGQLVIHRARPEGDGWDRAAFNVRVVAESSPLLLERNR